MTPERYQRIGQLFDQALEFAPEQRADFLKQASGDDAELYAEVEKLLANHSESSEFLSRPALDIAAKQMAQNQTASALRKQIGRYQILSLLGVGGMGVVYLADDTRLRRKIALKLLTENIAQDKGRLRRFEQEAFAASALNHPNILTIFEFGSEGETHFLASEFVEGETLRSRLQRAPLPLNEVLDIGVQTTQALAAAHAAGIVHRDMKPENIMLRGDGLVKVLDFGLAKLTEPSRDSNPSDSDIRTLQLPHTNTHPGAVLGTPNYMSPEQARGLAVDARTDIFSLGIMLYEMSTGKTPFAGETPSDVIAEILKSEPAPLGSLIAGVPREFERIVERTLRKPREERYQDIQDLLTDLRNLKSELDFQIKLGRSSPSYSTGETILNRTIPKSGVVTNETLNEGTSYVTGAHGPLSLGRLVAQIKLHKPAAVITGLVVIALLTGFAAYYINTNFNSDSTAKAPLPAASARIIPFTTFPGAANQPAFSPDGNQIAFAWDGGNGENLDLYIKLIGAGTPLRLTTDPAEDISPVWSPDGRYLAFIRRSASENGVFIIPALGGAERKLGQTEPSVSRQAWPQCRLSWSPDGKFLALADRASPQERYGIFLLSVEDGGKQRLTSPPESFADNFPAFSPDGQTLAFIRSSGFSSEDLYLISTHGGNLRRLTTDERRMLSVVWTADGREIVFSSNRGGGFSLWRVAVSGGTPEQMAVTGLNAYSPAISRQGNRLAYNVSFIDSNIWRLDRSSVNPQAAGRQNLPTKLISSTRQDHSPQFSPDGKRIVFVSDRSGSDEIWVCESVGSNPAQLTFLEGTVGGSPRWSPDGQQIVFDARPAGNSDIYVISTEGGKPRALTLEPSHDVMPSWSRDGRWIYFCSNRSGDFQTWKVPAAGGPAVQVTKQGGFEAFESPGSELLYYTKGRGRGGIWQMPVAGGEERQVPELLDAGYWRYWAVLDDGIYFVAPVATARPAIKFFNFATRRVMQLGVLDGDPLQGPSGFTVSPDGRWVLYAQADQSISDIMLVENFR
jgi:Tol biopolymer transport system component/tRNA A-37 threonylcarbamoyl transferase component Bud32